MSIKNEERSAVRKAVIGVVLVAIVMGIALNLSRIASVLGTQHYSAELTDGGGARSGDDVRVDGIKVGKVTGLKIDGNTVQLDFEAGGIKVGDQSRLYVRSDNALGRKYVDLELAGTGDIRSIPVGRTDPGYAVTQVLGNLTTTAEKLDTARIAKAFDSLSSMMDGSPQQFGAALRGVSRLSRTIGSRDSELNQLLVKASSVSGLLSARNHDIVDIFGSGSEIFHQLVERQAYVSALFANITSATAQIRAFVKENHTRMPAALTDLKGVADTLASYRSDLESYIVDFAGYVRGLGDAISSGPFFQALIPNLTTPESIGTGALGSLTGGHR